jgi:HEAT repeat protein
VSRTLAVLEASLKQVNIEAALKKLDGRGTDEEYEAVKILTALGDQLPELLLQKYRVSKKWGERASCVYHSIKYAKTSIGSFQLGIEATQDKSKNVRYRACMFLAIAQKEEAIPMLEPLLKDIDSADDAAAAIDAIKNKNHHYFADRDHSGMVKLNV